MNAWILSLVALFFSVFVFFVALPNPISFIKHPVSAFTGKLSKAEEDALRASLYHIGKKTLPENNFAEVRQYGLANTIVQYGPDYLRD